MIMSSSKFNVNRLALLPQKRIPATCPTFVIEFIAKSLGIKYNYNEPLWKTDESKIKSIVDMIESTLEDEEICLDEIDIHLRDIALFVNPESSVQWNTRTALLNAFWSIHNFSPKIPLKSDEIFGYKTEENPYAIDPAMTYHIAAHYRMRTSRDTTLEQIQNEIVNFSAKLTPLRYSIFTKLARMSRRGLVDLKTHFFIDSPTNIHGGEFPGYSYPSTYEEAIERAANDYRWDISLSKNPIEEYIELDRVSDDKYSPIDIEWGKIFDVNRHYFHLDFRYISKFKHLYTDNGKRGLLYRNGGSDKSEYLTFGVHPLYPDSHNIRSLRSVINQDTISEDYITRYRTLIGSPDFIISRKELSEFWESEDAFISPHDPSKEFSENHLRMIKVNSETNDPLKITIENIKSKRRLNLDKALYYCLEYELAIEILHEILHLGLLIRGYTICYDNLPLSESNYDVDKYQDEISDKTYILALKILTDYEEFITKIPLITGRNILGDDTTTYVLRPFGRNMTLKCIINRILHPDNDDSCIRTNSNYLLSTAWYFLNELESSPPFKLEDLVFMV